jgi:hypothetical protein
VSIEVAPDALAETVERFGVSYLLTLGDRPRPHVGAVNCSVTDGVVRVSNVGRTGRRNAAAHNAVTLLWPPLVADGHSLIVDGTATVTDDGVNVVVVRAVLHRPAPAAQPTEGSCGSDCTELPLASSSDS